MPLVDAPASFQAKLRALDPALSARLVNFKLNRKGDRGFRWVIYWVSPKSGIERVAHIVEEAVDSSFELRGGFRPLDDRVIRDLYLMDAWNRDDKKILDEMQAVSEGMENESDKEVEELATAMAKDFRRLFAGEPLVASGWTVPR